MIRVPPLVFSAHTQTALYRSLYGDHMYVSVCEAHHHVHLGHEPGRVLRGNVDAVLHRKGRDGLCVVGQLIHLVNIGTQRGRQRHPVRQV